MEYILIWIRACQNQDEVESRHALATQVRSRNGSRDTKDYQLLDDDKLEKQGIR
jgi:hypothetical protein